MIVRKRIGSANYKIGIALTATLAATLTVALATPSVYCSTSTVLVAPPEMAAPTPRAPLPGEREARLDRIRDEILSRSRLEALLDKFDVYGPSAKPDHEATLTRLRRDIKAETRAVDLGTQGIAYVGARNELLVALLTRTGS